MNLLCRINNGILTIQDIVLLIILNSYFFFKYIFAIGIKLRYLNIF
jgi:hypothetical protein